MTVFQAVPHPLKGLSRPFSLHAPPTDLTVLVGGRCRCHMHTPYRLSQPSLSSLCSMGSHRCCHHSTSALHTQPLPKRPTQTPPPPCHNPHTERVLTPCLVGRMAAAAAGGAARDGRVSGARREGGPHTHVPPSASATQQHHAAFRPPALHSPSTHLALPHPSSPLNIPPPTHTQRGLQQGCHHGGAAVPVCPRPQHHQGIPARRVRAHRAPGAQRPLLRRMRRGPQQCPHTGWVHHAARTLGGGRGGESLCVVGWARSMWG